MYNYNKKSKLAGHGRRFKRNYRLKIEEIDEIQLDRKGEVY